MVSVVLRTRLLVLYSQVFFGVQFAAACFLRCARVVHTALLNFGYTFRYSFTSKYDVLKTFLFLVLLCLPNVSRCVHVYSTRTAV